MQDKCIGVSISVKSSVWSKYVQAHSDASDADKERGTIKKLMERAILQYSDEVYGLLPNAPPHVMENIAKLQKALTETQAELDELRAYKKQQDEIIETNMA